MTLPHSGRPDTGPPTNFDIWLPEIPEAKTLVDGRYAARKAAEDALAAELAKVLPPPAGGGGGGGNDLTATNAAAAGQANFAALQAANVTAVPATAWTTGQFVTLGDGSKAHWTGSAWATGAA